MTDIWFNDKYVYGGRAAIVTTFFGDAPLPMFDDPPKCWLHKQGNFITSFFPEGTEAGVDYDFFYLPGRRSPPTASPSWWPVTSGPPSNDRPEVRAVMECFTTGRAPEGLDAGRRRDCPAQGCRPRLVRQSTSSAAWPRSSRTPPPSASTASDLMPGRGGRWLLLEGHDRLRRRRRPTSTPPSRRSTPPGRSKFSQAYGLAC